MSDLVEAKVTVCVLGSYGEFVGSYLAHECLSRPNIVTKILVRPGYEAYLKKKEIVDSLVSKGAIVVYGDASDKATLLEAFVGVDVIVSALGGWGDVGGFHDNVYEAAKSLGTVKRIVPAQFGFDVLELPTEEMDEYMKKKRAWNIAGIESGIPYTIVSHGAFAEWMITNSDNQFVHHEEGIVDHAGSPDVEGWVTTTCRDTARLTIDSILDPEMANKRISIAASRMSATGIANALSKATGKTYRTRCLKTLEEIDAGISAEQPPQEKFNDYILGNWARNTFHAGFSEPFLVDTLTRYGWAPESFEDACIRLLAPE